MKLNQQNRIKVGVLGGMIFVVVVATIWLMTTVTQMVTFMDLYADLVK